MARRRQFVSSGLHNISKHIADSTSEKAKEKSKGGSKITEKSSAEDEVVAEEVEEQAEVAIPEVKQKDDKSSNVEDNVAAEIKDESQKVVVEDTVVSEKPVVESLMEHNKQTEDLPERREKERRNAVKRRSNEFVNARRDMMSRLTQSLATIPDDIETCDLKVKMLNKYKEIYEDLLVRIEPLDESAWSEDNYTAELGRAMKVIENTRLEYLSSNTRLEKILNGDEVAVAHQQALIADLASLSFGQLFRMGIIFSLPIVIGMILAALIISISYFIVVG